MRSILESFMYRRSRATSTNQERGPKLADFLFDGSSGQGGSGNGYNHAADDIFDFEDGMFWFLLSYFSFIFILMVSQEWILEARDTQTANAPTFHCGYPPGLEPATSRSAPAPKVLPKYIHTTY